MATALGARLGCRPALAGPGRSSGFAVCSPLRKPALRRPAAAEPPPPPPLPPLPAGEGPPPSQPANQPPNQPPNHQGTVPQAAPATKQWWDFDSPLWQVKLVALGVCLLSAARSVQLGMRGSALVHLLTIFLILVTPWFDSD